MIDALKQIAREPPIRLLLRAMLSVLPTSVRTKAQWELGRRPNYLIGILAAADQARREGIAEISVIEFGVAGGNGLLALERWAAAVERALEVTIAVYGFDTGAGLPELCGDYRDHPDHWRPSDYPMDVDALRRRLGPRTRLVLGNTRETVPEFARTMLKSPIGFAAIDVDLYSSTRDVLTLLTGSGRRMLRRTYLYFDDIADPKATFMHRFAGELLAIEEFNQASAEVKIDRWRGLRGGRIFPERDWIEKMYIAHDLEAINRAHTTRQPLAHFRLER